jgi:DNA-binding transcriptional MerR regulator
MPEVESEVLKVRKERTPAQIARILERGSKILALRRDGASLRAISAALKKEAEAEGRSTRGYSYEQVRQDFKEIVELRIEEQQEQLEEVRALAAERLDEVVMNFMPMLRTKIDGDTSDNLVRAKLKAGDLIIRATKEFAELFGAKRPQKIELGGLDGEPLFPKDISHTINTIYGNHGDKQPGDEPDGANGDAGRDAAEPT